MKIGIIGNMNNMYFSLARYLADEGYDCELLLLDNEPAHFHPTADAFSAHPNLTIKQLTWGDAAGFFKKRERVRSDLQPYSFLIGSDTAPAFARAVGRKLDLFIPYGYDLYKLPFGHLVHPVRQLAYWMTARQQLRGIQECPYILFDKTSPEFDRVFQRLNYRGKRIISPSPLLYHKEYVASLPRQQKANPYFSLLQELRNQNELLVLQHGRQVWQKRRDPWSLKGNHHLISGYAQFVATDPSRKSKLLLLEYGDGIDEAKALIERLKLSERVFWFPKMLRKNLMAVIQTSDVVVGELHYSWNTYCVALEALAMGKPLIHKRNDAYLADAYPKLYSMLNASSANEVCQALQTVWQNKEAMHKMGEEGKEWFDEYCVKKPLKYITQLIDEKAKELA